MTVLEAPMSAVTGPVTGPAVPRPAPQLAPDGTEIPVYLGASEFARLLGLYTARLHSMRVTGWIIDPDVVVGPATDPTDPGPDDPAAAPIGGAAKRQEVYGWDYDRALAFGIETGRLADDGAIIKANRGGGPLGPPPADWRREAVRYLDRYAAAHLLGITFDRIYSAHQRGTFIPAAVYVSGTRFPGWRREDLIRGAMQLGLELPPDVEHDVQQEA